jgi:hypothetical protein
LNQFINPCLALIFHKRKKHVCSREFH